MLSRFIPTGTQDMRIYSMEDREFGLRQLLQELFVFRIELRDLFGR